MPQPSEPEARPGNFTTVVRQGPWAEGESRAECWPDDVATGGGGEGNPPFAGVVESFPDPRAEGSEPTAWVARAPVETDPSEEPFSVRAYVVCAPRRLR